MTEIARTRALYNADCPICNSEMCRYAAHAGAAGLPIAFDDLNATDLALWGVTEDRAARLLHVIHDGRLHVGFDAMLVLWAQMPRMRGLARLCRVPGLFHLLDWGYANVVARLIYLRHKRRGRLGLRTAK
ncbi:MAG: DCC1-like thiol-disulfide oxidoreductase family protein [Paracoccaceae bacterium]